MNKIWNILIVLILMISISSLVLADDTGDTTDDEPPESGCVWAFDESNAENECSKYCDMWMFENASSGYDTFEECEECRIEFLNNQSRDNDTEEPDPQDPVIEEPRIDIVFVIDSTGSMSDEIREVKL